MPDRCSVRPMARDRGCRRVLHRPIHAAGALLAHFVTWLKPRPNNCWQDVVCLVFRSHQSWLAPPCLSHPGHLPWKDMIEIDVLVRRSRETLIYTETPSCVNDTTDCTMFTWLIVRAMVITTLVMICWLRTRVQDASACPSPCLQFHKGDDGVSKLRAAG